MSIWPKRLVIMPTVLTENMRQTMLLAEDGRWTPQQAWQEIIKAWLVENENHCPGHVASNDPKICLFCGAHVDSFRGED